MGWTHLVGQRGLQTAAQKPHKPALVCKNLQFCPLKVTDIYSNQSVSLPCSCQLFFCFGTAAWTRSQISESWDNTGELWGLLKGRAGRLRSTWVDCFLRYAACLSGQQRVPSWFSSVQSLITLCWLATLQYMHFLALQIFSLCCQLPIIFWLPEETNEDIVPQVRHLLQCLYSFIGVLSLVIMDLFK